MRKPSNPYLLFHHLSPCHVSCFDAAMGIMYQHSCAATPPLQNGLDCAAMACSAPLHISFLIPITSNMLCIDISMAPLRQEATHTVFCHLQSGAAMPLHIKNLIKIIRGNTKEVHTHKGFMCIIRQAFRATARWPSPLAFSMPYKAHTPALVSSRPSRLLPHLTRPAGFRS